MKHIRIWQWLVLASAIAFILCCNGFVFARDAKPTTGLIEGSDLVKSDTSHTEVLPHEGYALRVKRSKKSSAFEEEGGHKHGEDHYSKKGEKGDKGYKKKHHFDKGDKVITMKKRWQDTTKSMEDTRKRSMRRMVNTKNITRKVTKRKVAKKDIKSIIRRVNFDRY